jgi:hypothetical protein
MRKNWPYFIVASFLNAVFITGAFIEFKLRGMGLSPQPTWYEINPFIFSGGIFITSFLVIMAIIVIKDLVSGIGKKLHAPQPPKGEEIPLYANTAISFRL